MSSLQALIFDVDGTLADTERHGHRVAFNRAFAETGLDWDWSEQVYGELLEITGGKERIQFYRNRDYPTFQPDGDLKDWAATLHRTKTRHYKQLLQDGIIPLRPGVQRLIQEARDAGVRLAIATTTTPENVTTLLEMTLGPDSPTWFEVIAAGDMVPAKKPAPDVYHYVLQAMSLAPNECLALEDSYQGLQSAMQAGIPTLITLNDYTRQHDFTGAVLVVDHLGEPDLPFQAIAGNPNHATIVDLELARSLLSK